jgi:hypothetical protein
MKRQTEKPSEQVMQFFTPELYQQFNSSNDDEADRADAAWEAAVEAYRRHLDSIRDKMPSQVRSVAELCLHDAELLACTQEVQSLFAQPVESSWPGPVWSAVAILSLRQAEKVWSLIYLLWDRLQEHPPKEDWRFSQSHKHWLYDEVDLAADQRGMFVHRILFSDGSVLEIPFVSVVTHSFSWEQ